MRARRAIKRPRSFDAEVQNSESENFEDSADEWKDDDKTTKRNSNAGTAKKGRRSAATKKAKNRKVESESSSDNDEENEDEDGNTSEGSDADENAGKKGRTTVKTKPDKDGYMELLLFKNDLTKDFIKDEKLCMWRRDSSLLQKYIFVVDESKNKTLIFKGSSVYSIWEKKGRPIFSISEYNSLAIKKTTR